MASLNSIPSDRHYAIVTEETIYIPGDERSRTNPGHGYPESTQTVIKYQAFTDKEAWIAKIESYERKSIWDKVDYKAFVVEPARITKSVSVNIE